MSQRLLQDTDVRELLDELGEDILNWECGHMLKCQGRMEWECQESQTVEQTEEG